MPIVAPTYLTAFRTSYAAEVLVCTSTLEQFSVLSSNNMHPVSIQTQLQVNVAFTHIIHRSTL